MENNKRKEKLNILLTLKSELTNIFDNVTVMECKNNSIMLIDEPEVILKGKNSNFVCEFGYTFSTTAKDIEYGGLNTWKIAIKYKDSDEWIKIFEYEDGIEINCMGEGQEIKHDNLIVYKKLSYEEIHDINLIIQDNLMASDLFKKYLISDGESLNKTKVYTLS